jgi:hypothetical protein
MSFLHPEEMEACVPHPEEELQSLIGLPQGDEQNTLKIVSPPPIKVLTIPVHLRKPVKCTANEKNPPNPELNIHKNPSLHLSSGLPASGLHCSALTVAFPFSLKNPEIYQLWLSFSCLTSQFPGL